MLTFFEFSKNANSVKWVCGAYAEKELEDIFDAFLCEMTQLPAVFISFTSIPRATRYYEPFLTETVEGQVSTDIGTITKQGTIYYEYNGI